MLRMMKEGGKERMECVFEVDGQLHFVSFSISDVVNFSRLRSRVASGGVQRQVSLAKGRNFAFELLVSRLFLNFW